MSITLAVVRTNWAGTSGGPGLTQLAIQHQEVAGFSWETAAQPLVNAVRAFWNATPNTIPNDLTLTVSPVVDIYNAQSGELVGSYSAATAPASVVGTATGSFSMASGAKIRLNTGQIRNGRRVRGSIFLVPCSGDVFDASGLVSATPRAGWVTAANTMRTALNTANCELSVWCRPTAKGADNGAAFIVSGVEVPTKGAVLRGRRD